MIDILRPIIRATRWGGTVAAAVPATFLAWHLQNQPFLYADSAGIGVRVAAIMITAGLAFSLDDPTEDSTGSAPFSIMKRRALRIALVFPIAICYWLALRSWVAGGISVEGQTLPTSPLILEFTTFAFLAYAGAALGTRTLSDRLGGIAGAGTVLLAAIALAILPWGTGVLSRTPGSPQAAAVDYVWQILLVVGVAGWWRFSLPPGIPVWSKRRAGARVATVAVQRHRS